MKRAILYARVSSAMQEKERTIESQIAELKRQIKASGAILTKEYIDDGYSGSLLDRPAMNQLRADLKAHQFDTIFILNADRIARDVTYQNIIIGEFLHHKKQIIINGKDYVNNPENKFTLTVLGAVSELERAKTIERIMRGRQHRIKQGSLLGNGHQTFGYNYIHKTATSFPSYEVNVEEAKIIQYIFETYAKGNIGVKAVSRQLEQMGVKARNRLRWSNIKFILQNEMYTGVRYSNTMTDTNALAQGEHRQKHPKRVDRNREDWIGIKIPAIIPKDLFDKASGRLKYNMECYRNAKRTQLLSNLVFCGKCDERCFSYRRYYQVERKDGKRIYQKAVYRCRQKGKTHNPEIDTRILESCVIDMIKETILSPLKLRRCIENKKINKEKTEKQIASLEEKLKSIVKQKQRIIDLYATGDLEREEYIKRIMVYEQQAESLQKEKSEIGKYLPLFQNPNLIDLAINEYCKNAKVEFGNCTDFESKRRFLLGHISKVSYRRAGPQVHHRSTIINDKIKLHGLILVKTEDNPTEPLQIEFTVEQTVNRVELMTKVRQMDLKNGSWDGIEIKAKDYGAQVMAKTPEIINA